MKVLFRNTPDTNEEYDVCKTYFDVITCRTLVENNDLIIPRYSSLPYHQELENDIQALGARLINPTWAHNFIADMSWINLLKDITFPTYGPDLTSLPDSEHGWIVKGKTNSRKFQWNRLMRAKNRIELREVVERLYDDPLISSQGLVIREFQPLEIIEEGINGIPFSNEWRFFYYGDQALSGAFYWSSAENANTQGDPPQECAEIASEAARRVREVLGINIFVVIDVAKKENGEWVIVELNDGCMSGLSENDPHKLYRNLKNIL